MPEDELQRDVEDYGEDRCLLRLGTSSPALPRRNGGLSYTALLRELFLSELSLGSKALDGVADRPVWSAQRAIISASNVGHY